MSFRFIAFGCLLLFCCRNLAVADRVETANGDNFAGKVLSLDTNTLTLQNENLGIIKLPRGKVTRITLDPPGGTNAAARPAISNSATAAPLPVQTNNFFALFNRLGVTSNLFAQIQKQYLAGAPQEAREKYSELMGGLLSGKLTMADLREQAKSIADQVRSVRKDMDEEQGAMVDAYLSILDRFLNSASNSP